jgi:hypothetical protein
MAPTRRESIGASLSCSIKLVHELRNNESHLLAPLVEVVGLLVEKYEDEQVPELEESSAVRAGPPTS